MSKVDLNQPMVIAGRNVWYGLDGEPISTWEADKLLGDQEARQVALTEHGVQFEPGYWRVSTLFLVMDMDHMFSSEGPPVLWETALLDSEHLVDAWRYSTREEALDGHEAMVQRAMKERP